MATSVAGLNGVSLKLELNSAFVQSTKKNTVRRSSSSSASCKAMSRVTCFQRDWLRKDPTVIGFGLIGWIAPSSIPAINGNSLTGLFFGSIGPELAHWPTGPSIDSPFWLWLILWHLGLFITLTFGQIGFKGRADGYF